MENQEVDPFHFTKGEGNFGNSSRSFVCFGFYIKNLKRLMVII